MIPKMIEQINAISERLKKEYSAQRVILFGSYVTGKVTEDSDVDILKLRNFNVFPLKIQGLQCVFPLLLSLIIAPTRERFFKRAARVKCLIRDLRKGLLVAPIVLTQEELRNRLRVKDQFIRGILKTGLDL